MKKNIISLQYLLSWQVMVYIHHRKKPQCLTWLWRMWKHWQVEKMEIMIVMHLILLLVLMKEV